MYSYDVGMVLGYLQAKQWLHESKEQKSIQDISTFAKIAFSAHCSVFDVLIEQDFLDGFNDGVETVYKGQLIAVA